LGAARLGGCRAGPGGARDRQWPAWFARARGGVRRTPGGRAAGERRLARRGGRRALTGDSRRRPTGTVARVAEVYPWERPLGARVVDDALVEFRTWAP